MKPERLLARIRAGHTANVRFDDLRRLVESVGFRLERIRGSHHVYRHPGARIELALTKQRGQAAPYQIRQFLRMVDEYNLKAEVR